MAYKVNIRDKFVERVITLLVNHVATPKYRRYFNAVEGLGMLEFDKAMARMKKQVEYQKNIDAHKGGQSQ